MKIGCLFGSGISLKAGYKRVSDITDIILSGKDISSRTYPKYCILPPMYSQENNEDENVNRITNYLNLLYNKNKQYNKEFNNNFSLNYEDLYYIVRQLHDELLGEQKNLIVRQYLQNFEINPDSMLTVKNHGPYHNFTIKDLIIETMTYINRIVTDLLLLPKNDISYMKIIKEISEDKDTEGTDIFSLNHDLLFETYFDENNITYCDGFNEPKDKSTLKHFEPNLFNNNNKINLLKLHGSSNWFRYKEGNTEFIAKSISSDIDHKKDENGKHILPVYKKAEILIGTFNKLIDYNYGIFSELLCLFINKLSQINILIISGYGFGDEGINAKIIGWYYKDKKNKIILIHSNFEKLKIESSFKYKFDDMQRENRFFLINKKFQDATYEEIKQKLEENKWKR